MRPHLIVDFREHSLFALLLTEEGDLVPCSQELEGAVTRYLPADLLLDPSVAERADFDWEAVQDLFLAGTQRAFAARSRRLGLLRPWELQSGSEAVVMEHPLAVLSSPVTEEEPARRRELLEATAFMIRELLSPIFRFVSHRELATHEVEVVAVVSAKAGRRAILMLHKIFRQAGFRRLGLLRRESAAALALLLEGSPSGNLIVDLEDEALHVHKVLLGHDTDHITLETAGSRSLRGLGRSFLIQRLAAALQRTGRLPERAPLTALGRALLGLSGIAYSEEVPGEPPFRLTHGLLGELFAAGLGDKWASELNDRLRPILLELGTESAPIMVGLGSALATPEVEELLVRAVDGKQPVSVAQTPVRERCARGVAALLIWLAGNPHRRLEVREAGGLRIDTMRGGSLELLSAATLPQAPGESRVIHQRLRLECASRTVYESGRILVNLFWGCNPDPRYAASLCTLAVDVATTRAPQPHHLDLVLHFKRNRHGRLVGWVDATLAGAHGTQRLRFAADGLSPRSATLPESDAAQLPVGAVVTRGV